MDYGEILSSGKKIKKIRKERKRPFFDNCYQKWSFLKNLK